MKNVRIPFIPLDYEDRYKAVEKELMVDYEQGNIYVVSKDDRSVIIDITQKIKDQLERLSGDNVIVNVQGLGEVNLTEIINKLYANGIQLTDIGDEKAIYQSKKDRIDNQSIECKYKRIQITNFDEARNYMVPQKFGDGVRWVYLPGYTGSDDEEYDTGDEDPDDGNKSNKVLSINPINAKIFLMATKRQKTVNLVDNSLVVLPTVLDEFCEIYWYLTTTSQEITLIFGSNVIFRGANQPVVSGKQLYKFVTFDHGETWLAECNVYSNTSVGDPVDDVVTVSYLQKYYLSKIDILADYTSTVDLKKNYATLNYLKDKYYNKDEINERFCTLNNLTTVLENYEPINAEVDARTVLLINKIAEKEE